MTRSDKGYSPTDLKTFLGRQRAAFLPKADAPAVPLASLRGRKPTKKQLAMVMEDAVGERILTVQPFRRTTLHHLFFVTTSSHQYILRTRAYAQARALEFFLDQWAYARLRAHKLPVLKVYAVDVSRFRVPFDFEIIDRAAGSWLYTWVRKNPSIGAIVEDLGRVVARCHRISTEGFGLLDIRSLAGKGTLSGMHRSWPAYLLMHMQEHIDFLCAKRIMTPAMGRTITHAFDTVHTLRVTPVLLHGDIAHQNIFTDGKRVTALIDWEDALSGDAVYDLAYYGSGSFGHEEWFDAFVKGYRSVGSLPADFQRRYWLYYVRISIAKAVSRIRWGIGQSRALPNLKDRITYGLSHLPHG